MRVAPRDSPKAGKEEGPTTGIPDRANQGDLGLLSAGELLDLVVQLHKARRAGEHRDVRIGDKERGLYSWATRHGLPEAPGKRVALFRQPMHSHAYKDFTGIIPEGYGAGEVFRDLEDKVLLTATHPDGGFSFTTAGTGSPARYRMIPPKDGNGWLIVRSSDPEGPTNPKEHMKSLALPDAEARIREWRDVSRVQPKISGALHVLKLLKDRPELFSHRTSRRTGGPIIHTERVFGEVPRLEIPEDLRGKEYLGEVYATDKEGSPLSEQQLGGLLNATIANSLEKRRREGVAMRLALHDIAGDSRPYEQKLSDLQRVVALRPDVFELMPETTTPEESLELLRSIQEGRNPLTSEGVILRDSTGKPQKLKFPEEADVWVRGVYPGEGKYAGGPGGFEYSLEPDGPVVGRVGTGFDDSTRAALEDYIGRVAKIRHFGQGLTGAYQKPALSAFHEDYSAPKTASADYPGFPGGGFRPVGGTRVEVLPPVKPQQGVVSGPPEKSMAGWVSNSNTLMRENNPLFSAAPGDPQDTPSIYSLGNGARLKMHEAVEGARLNPPDHGADSEDARRRWHALYGNSAVYVDPQTSAAVSRARPPYRGEQPVMGFGGGKFEPILHRGNPGMASFMRNAAWPTFVHESEHLGQDPYTMNQKVWPGQVPARSVQDDIRNINARARAQNFRFETPAVMAELAARMRSVHRTNPGSLAGVRLGPYSAEMLRRQGARHMYGENPGNGAIVGPQRKMTELLGNPASLQFMRSLGKAYAPPLQNPLRVPVAYPQAGSPKSPKQASSNSQQSPISSKSGMWKSSLDRAGDVRRELTGERKYPVEYLSGEAKELSQALLDRDWAGAGEEIMISESMQKQSGMWNQARALVEARKATDTNPSAAQIEAGNYAKGKFNWNGLEIALENPKGCTRSGTSKNGKTWSVTMKHDYGYFLGTKGRDKDHVDVFIGPDPKSEVVFVVDQSFDGKFDEHKVLAGFHNEKEARAGYLANYEKGWKGLGSITALTIPQFKEWLKSGDMSKPLAEQKIKTSGVQGPPLAKPVLVKPWPRLTSWLDRKDRFGRPGSPLRGSDIVDAAVRNRVDPRLFAAITANESGWGAEPPAVRANNFSGLMGSGRTLFKYPTPQAGLFAGAKNLHRRYVSRGLDTPAKIGPVYAPTEGASNDSTGMNRKWVPTVESIMGRMPSKAKQGAAGRDRVLQLLLEAKTLSDRGDYPGKHRKLRLALALDPGGFAVDSSEKGHPGLTHLRTGFRIHAPARVLQERKI